jgi:hypothetical protein
MKARLVSIFWLQDVIVSPDGLAAHHPLAAITLDHFGAFGLTPHPIGAARLAGAVLLIAGVVLIRD